MALLADRRARGLALRETLEMMLPVNDDASDAEVRALWMSQTLDASSERTEDWAVLEMIDDRSDSFLFFLTRVSFSVKHGVPGWSLRTI